MSILFQCPKMAIYPLMTSTINGPTFYGMPHGSRMPNRPSPQIPYGSYIGNYLKRHAFKQNIFPLCTLCPLGGNDTCLHLLSCRANKHINKLHTNRQNKATHEYAKTILVHPTTWYFTFINAGKIKDNPPDNTLLAWLLACSC